MIYADKNRTTGRLTGRLTMTRQWHELDVTFDEAAMEYYAHDYDGGRHWGQTGGEAVAKALEANRVIVDHFRHCPEDLDAADDAAMYQDLRVGG